MTDRASPAAPSTSLAPAAALPANASDSQALGDATVILGPLIEDPIDSAPSADGADGAAGSAAIRAQNPARRRLARAFATTRRGQVALVIAVVVLFFVVAANPYRVQQFSMERTLEPGELLLVDRVLPNLTGLSRGDIVVFKLASSAAGAPPLVKRIVGLPGDTVALRDGAVWVNGRRLDEPYVFDGQPTWPQPGKPSVVVVPAGCIFVLGDHRSSSADSRVFGPVPLDRIIGRVWFEARLDGLAALLGN